MQDPTQRVAKGVGIFSLNEEHKNWEGNSQFFPVKVNTLCIMLEI